MNVELKDFQETALDDLAKKVERARRDAVDAELQAVVLSSPTGSGKTIILTALMERLLFGGEGTDPDPEAVFVWLSDSPELNVQSRDKIASSSKFKPSQLVIVEPPFSQEKFEPGKIYFLNTQKLGKDSLLTKTGDGRDFTIWDAIQNTATAKPGSFFLILDEAHRGMTESPRAREQAVTIVQRFIKGEESVGLSPIPLIVGMSATPERFAKVIEGGTRTKREAVINPEAVRSSGLLKDRIVLYHPEVRQPSDWSMLAAAAGRWREYRKSWKAYCEREGLPSVTPVLVVQVEDGDEKVLTKTDLRTAVSVLEKELGPFVDGALAHCFQEDKDLNLNGHVIRKIEASRIQANDEVQVVFFKMALTTGWDCPRAETMMSFRRAADHTLIAQLVGRMVRTPLARRIEGDEFLNTVALYLPHYDSAGLRAILDKLRNPDPETGVAVEVEEGKDLVRLSKDPAKADLFAALEKLPSYSVERITKTSSTRRLMKLSRQLAVFDGIDKVALQSSRDLVIETLSSEWARLRRDETFRATVTAGGEIVVREVHVEYGQWKESATPRTIKIPATTENIEDLFDRCERVLGEGLKDEYWKRKADAKDPLRAKIELVGLLQNRTTWEKLEAACSTRIDQLFAEHSGAIAALKNSRREVYRRIRRQALIPTAEGLSFPATIEIRREAERWEGHLYVNDDGGFHWDANSWEAAVLKEEVKRGDFLGWLRFIPRRDWALCIPYGSGEDKPLYPDFVSLRRDKGKIRVDLLDPHNPALSDAWEKAVGLARYAHKHGDAFGRIELVQVDKGHIRRLALQDSAVRAKAMSVKSNDALELLFAQLG
jgi:type III restriction enzyme